MHTGIAWGDIKKYWYLDPTPTDLLDQGSSLGIGITMEHAFTCIKGLWFIMFEKWTPKQKQLTYEAIRETLVNLTSSFLPSLPNTA